jgi:hypothetical protein
MEIATTGNNITLFHLEIWRKNVSFKHEIQYEGKHFEYQVDKELFVLSLQYNVLQIDTKIQRDIPESSDAMSIPGMLCNNGMSIK